MAERQSWIQMLADRTDLGTEPLPGIPLIEIAGYQRVLIEGHSCVVEYGDCEISARVSYGVVCVQGSNLFLRKMTREQLVISGDIQNVVLKRRNHK